MQVLCTPNAISMMPYFISFFYSIFFLAFHICYPWKFWEQLFKRESEAQRERENNGGQVNPWYVWRWDDSLHCFDSPLKSCSKTFPAIIPVCKRKIGLPGRHSDSFQLFFLTQNGTRLMESFAPFFNPVKEWQHRSQNTLNFCLVLLALNISAGDR